jgi:hypothetical protein
MEAMHGAQPVNIIAPRRSMMLRAALALIVIACGLFLRWYGFRSAFPPSW